MTTPILLRFTYNEAGITSLTQSVGYRVSHPVTKLDIVQDCIKRLSRMEEALLIDIYGVRTPPTVVDTLYDELKGINGGHDGDTESRCD